MNILIADDEALMRTSLHLYLKDNQIPDSCIYHAENASDMLRHFENQQIDIAFIDIRMPGTDGLTAIEACKKLQPDTHYYILTGYSEFEYAHKALQLHIEDYLLKPVSPDQIRHILQKERLHFQAEMCRQENDYAQAFSQIILGQSTEPYPVPAALACFSGTMDMESFHKLTDSIYICLTRDFRLEIFKYSFLCWEYFVIHQETIPDRARNFLNRQIRHLPCNMLLLSAAGNNHKEISLQSIQSDSLQTAFAPLGICYTSAEDFLCLRRLGQSFAKLLYFLGEKNFDQFCLASGQMTAILNREKDLMEHGASEQIIHILNHFFHDPHYTASHLQDVPQLLNVFAVNNLLFHSVPNNNLLSIKQYIESHYHEKITLPLLSKHFGYTPNYISSAFRKYTGLTVTQYLNQIRLSNACRLLAETDMTIQEIAETVGFLDSNYFTRMFNQQYQCPPTAYRKRALFHSLTPYSSTNTI